MNGTITDLKDLEKYLSAMPGCVECGAPAPFLCDYEVEPGRTCDAPLCGRCRYNIGVKDYCPAHAGLAGINIQVTIL